MNRLTLSIFVVLFLALTPAFAADATADQNKAVVRQVYEEVFNTGNVEHLDKYMAADSVDHEVMPGKTGPQTCQDTVKEFVSVFRAAFPDLKFKVEDMIAEGDKVVARCTLTGTHKGDFMGMPATGKTFSIEVVDILRFKDGKCVEHWGVADMAAMMEQLGDSAGK